MRPTFHLTPAERWEASDPERAYTAPSLEDEGFIHCTDGRTALLATANRHYGDDPRSFLALTLDLDAVSAPWRVDDARAIYPHLYGPIDRAAILRVASVTRDRDGRFTGLDPVDRDDD